MKGQPFFQWKESVLLRAVVGRIAAATVISPKGFYSQDEEAEDESKVVENEEFEPISSDELILAENWVHHRCGILKQGRVKPYVKPENEDEGITLFHLFALKRIPTSISFRGGRRKCRGGRRSRRGLANSAIT